MSQKQFIVLMLAILAVIIAVVLWPTPDKTVTCEQCGAVVTVDEAHWLDSQHAICPNCFRSSL